MRFRQYHNRQTGFTLIEVLVSLVILTMGILGIMGMQTISLASGIKSVSRGQAANLSYEIIDRMRANRTETYSLALNADISDFEDCFTGPCTTSKLATFDISEWKCAFLKYKSSATCTTFLTHAASTYKASQLPLDGDASVTCTNSGSETTCTVTITWNEPEPFSNTPQQHAYAVTVII